jgi:hypothetical protein
MVFRRTLTTIGGYEVLEKVGDGSLARVYKCRRTLFAKVVRAHEQSSAAWIVGCAFNQELSDSDIRTLRGVPGS